MPVTYTPTVLMAPIMPYSCEQSCCIGQQGPPFAPPAWPSVVYVNDGLGTVACPLIHTSGHPFYLPYWQGSATRVAQHALIFQTDPNPPHFCPYEVDGPMVNIFFGVGCENRSDQQGLHTGIGVTVGYETSTCSTSFNCGNQIVVAGTEDETNCGKFPITQGPPFAAVPLFLSSTTVGSPLYCPPVTFGFSLMATCTPPPNFGFPPNPPCSLGVSGAPCDSLACVYGSTPTPGGYVVNIPLFVSS